MELLPVYDHRIHGTASVSPGTNANLHSFQCSFLPRFHICVETRYENNSGEAVNVRFFLASRL
jgi:hypothetical protein